MVDKKIVFLGTPEIAAIFLEGIIKKGINISLVVTKPDKIRGRNNLVIESPVSSVAKKYSIDVFKPEKINNDYKKIKDLKSDLLLTFAYGQIISNEVLSLSKYKPLNIHGSLLPKYRGASPIQQALKNGDKITGISIIEMINKMDAGPIYAKKEILIDDKDNYTSLCEKVANESIDLILDFLPKYFNSEIEPVNQDEALSSYCHFILKNDYKLSIDEDINSFINHVRYLSYSPGAYLNMGNNLIKIYEVEKYSDTNLTNDIGKLFIDNKNLLLQLKKGVVKINYLQLPGKKIISSSDYINGNKNKNETIILS